MDDSQKEVLMGHWRALKPNLVSAFAEETKELFPVDEETEKFLQVPTLDDFIGNCLVKRHGSKASFSVQTIQQYNLQVSRLNVRGLIPQHQEKVKNLSYSLQPELAPFYLNWNYQLQERWKRRRKKTEKESVSAYFLLAKQRSHYSFVEDSLDSYIVAACMHLLDLSEINAEPCSLLLRDTNDAYKMGDGDRILLNAKFQMLLSRIGNHTKYQLWLFRFMAYCYSLLTPRMANARPGSKEKIYAQGANATYKSARNAALTLQIQEEIFTNMQKEVNKNMTGRRRPEPSKLNDITAMVSELQSARVFDFIPGREYTKFPLFSDIFSRLKVPELHKWITDNKERLSYETI
ncbi:unnamed protein product [Mytilus edulis]|uniref:Uncharacterized protein n=1 Tax=Mytilus edulis TaxID=6550 RepID=A0A8S3QPL9_MYTED|nr:unnamed protein product [Mytilus edulis]